MHDIFNPANFDMLMCHGKTQHDINVFYNRQFEKLFHLMRGAINHIKDNELLDEEQQRKIDDLERYLAQARGDLTDLNQRFIKLSADTTETLNLYKTDINELTNALSGMRLSVESNSQELNEIKQMINVDLLNQLINTYNDVWRQLDLKLAEIKINLNNQFLELKGNLENTVENELAQTLLEFNTLKTNLEAELNEFKSSVNLTLTNNVNTITNLIDEFRRNYAEFYDKYDSELKRVETESKNRDNTIVSEFHTLLTALNEEITTKINILKNSLNEFYENISADITILKNNYKTINEQLIAVKASDVQQWTTINNFITQTNEILDTTKNNIISINEKLQLLRDEINALDSVFERIDVQLHEFEEALGLVYETAEKNSTNVEKLIVNNKLNTVYLFDYDVEQLTEVNLGWAILHVYVSHDKTDKYVDLEFLPPNYDVFIKTSNDANRVNKMMTSKKTWSNPDIIIEKYELWSISDYTPKPFYVYLRYSGANSIIALTVDNELLVEDYYIDNLVNQYDTPPHQHVE